LFQHLSFSVAMSFFQSFRSKLEQLMNYKFKAPHLVSLTFMLRVVVSPHRFNERHGLLCALN
jgi:hypothetical protein